MMDALRLIDHPLWATLGWTLTHFLWQGALLGLAAFVVLRVIRPAQASTRYLVAVAMLAAMLLAPVATFFMSAGHTASARRTTSGLHVASAGLVTGAMIATVEGNPAAVRELLPTTPRTGARADAVPMAPVWLPLMTAVWLIGVTLLSLRMFGGWLVTKWLATRAVAAVSHDLQEAAHRVSRRLGLRRSVVVLESTAVTVPTLVGWLKPVVLLPVAALTGLSPSQWQAILAHEFAHVRRHDYLVNLLQTVVETLLFYHPAVWWVSSEIRVEREHCCDDLAVAVCGDRLVYVSALAELTSIERRAFALAATDGSLVARVRRILGRPGDVRRELPPSWGVLVLLVLVGGGAGTYELSAGASDVAEMAREAAGAAPTLDARRASTHPDGQPLPWSPFTPPAAPAPPPPPPPAEALAPLPAETPAPLPAEAPAPPLAPPAASPPASPPPAPSAPVAAPPAPPAAALAPAPPAPPAPRPRSAGAREQGHFAWSDDNRRLTLRWTGPFRLSDDERDIGWVEDGAQVTLADGWVFAHRFEFAGRGGAVARTYYRSGVKQDFDAAGREVLADALQQLIRSGMFATERVARLLAQGGPEAVLAEIDRMESGSSHLKRVYYTALVKQADLNRAHLAQIIDRISTTITSEHEKGMVLTLALQEPSADDDHRARVARAASTITSDHEQRKVLSAVVSGGAASPAVIAPVLAALATVASGHERAAVLMAIAGAGGVTAETSAAFMQAVATMPSSFEQRRVLATLNAAPALAGTVSRDRLRVARAMGSSHDKAEVLLQVVAGGGVSDDTATAFFDAVRSIASSHDKARVLLAVAAHRRLSEASLAAFLQAATTISSSAERAQVLVKLLETQPVTGATRTQYLDAAEGLSGIHDRNAALAALVRSERR